MDGPSEVNQVRAPKRPYPEEEEEVQDVCCLISPIFPNSPLVALQLLSWLTICPGVENICV